MKKIKDIPSALIQFEENSIRHAKATEDGKYKICNNSYAYISEAVTFLKENNKLDSLRPFLTHESEGVRMWAASYLLPLVEKESLKVLKEISERPGIHSLTAETVIKEWANGSLKV